MLKDRTWESVRIPLRFQLASPVLFLVAIGVARNDLSWSNFLAWVFLFNVAVPFMAGVPLLYFFMERREAKEIRQKQAD